MATGDQADIFARIKGRLPRWFDQGVTETPVLDAFLQGAAWALSFIHGLAVYANQQMRVTTATDGWLDLISGDFFGANLPRRPGQSDASYRALIMAGLIRERATRTGLFQVAVDLTGREPLIMEPRRPIDGAIYDGPGGYNVGKRYGSTEPFQVFMEVYRPVLGSQWDGIEDADIYAAISSVAPAGTKVWVRILDDPPA